MELLFVSINRPFVQRYDLKTRPDIALPIPMKFLILGQFEHDASITAMKNLYFQILF